MLQATLDTKKHIHLFINTILHCKNFTRVLSVCTLHPDITTMGIRMYPSCLHTTVASLESH